MMILMVLTEEEDRRGCGLVDVQTCNYSMWEGHSLRVLAVRGHFLTDAFAGSRATPFLNMVPFSLFFLPCFLSSCLFS
ncbi:hypothetical protein RIF29_07486 [Crotalaria pallida]|uniref:Uncharacterized protein n=1 Tax=Crotalaria pallida TaxID=3830 RepID=A0AAN9J469_CROPI